MKRAVLLVALLLLGASLAFGDVTFYLYVNGTTDSTLDIPPGETAELWVRLYADGGNAVSGAVYDVQLPMEGWTLASRGYSDYGCMRRTVLDGSVPDRRPLLSRSTTTRIPVAPRTPPTSGSTPSRTRTEHSHGLGDL